MTINLTELRDEPLGKHPLHATFCLVGCRYPFSGPAETERVMFGAAADGEGVFKFDVDGLSDEAMDIPPNQPCATIGIQCWISDDTLPLGSS